MMFYTLDQTKTALGKSEDEIRQFARDGQLHQFRDGPRLMFNADEVKQLKQQIAGTGFGPAAHTEHSSGTEANQRLCVPFALRYRQEGGTTTMSYPWLDLCAPLIVSVLLTATLLWGVMPGPAGAYLILQRSERGALVVLSAFLVVLLSLGYIGVAHLINWTRITLDGEVLRVRHRPLYWPSWGATVARQDIRSVAVEQCRMGGSADGGSRGSWKYQLYAELTSGKRLRLSPLLGGGTRLEFIASQVNLWRAGENAARSAKEEGRSEMAPGE